MRQTCCKHSQLYEYGVALSYSVVDTGRAQTGREANTLGNTDTLGFYAAAMGSAEIHTKGNSYMQRDTLWVPGQRALPNAGFGALFVGATAGSAARDGWCGYARSKSTFTVSSRFWVSLRRGVHTRSSAELLPAMRVVMHSAGGSLT